MHALGSLPIRLRERQQTTAALALLALGVVYGDIGTSPLYAAKETFNPDHGIPLTPDNILGGVSAIFWALMIVVSLKYVTLVLRADNRGEGGIMALLALASSRGAGPPALAQARCCSSACSAPRSSTATRCSRRRSRCCPPSKGSRSARRPSSPTSCRSRSGILHRAVRDPAPRHRRRRPAVRSGHACCGSSRSRAAGVWNIAKAPADPRRRSIRSTRCTSRRGHGFASFVVLGSVLLAITGAEALYADMGHFGKRADPHRLVQPGRARRWCSTTSGRARCSSREPEAIDEPVLSCSYPDWALYPMVALATAATVIASQATISGRLFDDPAGDPARLPAAHDASAHTSARTMRPDLHPGGQLDAAAAVVAAVIGFGCSSRLASAYGVAVMGTMLVTTLLTFFVMRYGWRYPLWLCVLATGFFLLIDARVLRRRAAQGRSTAAGSRSRSARWCSRHDDLAARARAAARAPARMRRRRSRAS